MQKSDFKEWSYYTVIPPTGLFTEISIPFSDISDCLVHTNNMETWVLEVNALNHNPHYCFPIGYMASELAMVGLWRTQSITWQG